MEIISYFDLATVFALAVLGRLLFLVLFEPGLAYKIDFALPAPDSENFLPLLTAVIDQPALGISGCEVFRNGAASQAARQVRRNIPDFTGRRRDKIIRGLRSTLRRVRIAAMVSSPIAGVIPPNFASFRLPPLIERNNEKQKFLPIERDFPDRHSGTGLRQCAGWANEGKRLV